MFNQYSLWIFRLWTVDNKETNTTALVAKMSTKEALRSLTCRARQDVDKNLRNLALLILGKEFF